MNIKPFSLLKVMAMCAAQWFRTTKPLGSWNATPEMMYPQVMDTDSADADLIKYIAEGHYNVLSRKRPLKHA